MRRRAGNAATRVRHPASDQGRWPEARWSRRGRRQAGEHGSEVLPAHETPPETYRQGFLARFPIFIDVAQIVDREHGDGEQPRSEAGDDHRRADAQRLHVVGPRHRHRSEEHQHEQVPQAHVPERPGTSGVEHTRAHRQHSDQEHRPSAPPHEIEAAHRREDQHARNAPLHHLGGRQTRLRHAQRSLAGAGIRSPLEVEEIVGEIGGDLDQHRTGQRNERGGPVQPAVAKGERGADEDRREGGRQGPGSRRHEPDGDRARRRGGGVPSHLFPTPARRGFRGAGGISKSRVRVSEGMRSFLPGPLPSCRRAWWHCRPAPEARPVRHSPR